jgi:N-acetylglucosaminyl-diphospho-decaprenol L-rhamnosyltransferase
VQDGVRVSVVVVSFNTRELLRRCLSQIELHHEVIVVDNDSRDGSAEMVGAEFPHVRLIRNPFNEGFGAANNRGIDVATGKYVLLLNSDAFAHCGAIDLLADYLDRGGSDFVGGKLENVDGSLQESAAGPLTLWAVFCEQTFLEKLFKNSAALSPYWKTRQLSDGGPVAQVMGACLMFHRSDIRFDERFFLYCEDTELCRRLGTGYYLPTARFEHLLGGSSQQNRWRSVALYNRGKELYFAIHQGPVHSALCFLLNRLGAILRIIAGLFVTRKAVTFWRVLFSFNPDPRRNRLAK